MEMLSLRLEVYVGAEGSVKGAGGYVAKSLWWSWRLCAESWRLCEQTKNRVLLRSELELPEIHLTFT